MKLIVIKRTDGKIQAFKQENFIELLDDHGTVKVIYHNEPRNYDDCIISAEDFWTTFRRIQGAFQPYQCDGCMLIDVESSPLCRTCCRNYPDRYEEIKK